MNDDESDELEALGIKPSGDPVADGEADATARVAVTRFGAGFEDDKLAAKFATLRASTQPAPETLAKLRRISESGSAAAEKLSGFAKAGDLIASQRAVHEDLMSKNIPDLANMPDARAARASEQTAGYMSALVDAALKTDERETEMLRLSKRNTTLAPIAAAGTIVSIIVTVVLALALR